jgi:hypothetical protein
VALRAILDKLAPLPPQPEPFPAPKKSAQGANFPRGPSKFIDSVLESPGCAVANVMREEKP